jgi:hypothetical protein
MMICGSEVEQKATMQEVPGSKPTVVTSFFPSIMPLNTNLKENMLKFKKIRVVGWLVINCIIG